MADFDWSIAGPFLIITALVALAITPAVLKDIRAAKAARKTTPAPAPKAPPVYPICARNGCRRTRDHATGEYMCGTCGRPMAIERTPAS